MRVNSGLMSRAVLALAAVVTIAMPAEAAVMRNGMVVRDQGNGMFEVRFNAHAGTTDYWCAAGQYGRRLRMQANDRIYRVTPPPLRAGQGVVFSTRPDQSSGRSGVMTFGGPQDGSFSVIRAEEFCNNSNLKTRFR